VFARGVVYAIVTPMENNSTVLSVRVTAEERAILEAAAEQSRTSLSNFVRRKAVASAELEVLDRNIVTIPAKDWKKFESWLNKPAKDVPGLARLAQRKLSWDR
jgi:uncharacterized protein (DUF1778 family)